MSGRRELVDALAQARDMADGTAKIAELERIVAYADAGDDVRLGFDARIELIEAYDTYRGSWRMPAVFARCLAAYDRDRSVFQPQDAAVLRRWHKTVVAAACRTPRVGLTQTVAALDDLERRLRADGYGQQPTYALRCRLADHLGDQAAARDWLVRWRAAPRDENSDCAACDAAWQVALLAGWGDWAQAARVAEAVLGRPVPHGDAPEPGGRLEPNIGLRPGSALMPDSAPGRGELLDCPEQPERTLAAVMLPYLHLGRFADAAAAHARAYRRHRRERDAFPLLAEHLRFCALTGDHDRGLRILADQLGRLGRPYDEVSAMEFAAAGALICRIADEAGAGGRMIHRPAFGDRPAAELTVAALGDDLLAVTWDLAGRFDARNGTGHQSGRMAGWLNARPLCPPLALPPDEPIDEPVDEIAVGPLDDVPVDPVDETSVGPVDKAGGGSDGVFIGAGGGPDGVFVDVGGDLARPGHDSPTGPAAADDPAPLSVEAIVAVLDERGDRYVIGGDGAVGGRWNRAIITFERIGERREILHARVVAERRFTADRLAEAYEFCNAWNHDRLLPKAYAQVTDEGELILVGEVTTDLEHGVTRPQLAVLVNATLATGAAFADAVAALEGY